MNVDASSVSGDCRGCRPPTTERTTTASQRVVQECVVNVSEGRDRSVISALAEAAASHLLDVHSDPDHNRSVFTLAGPRTEEAVRALSRSALDLIDLRAHSGAHPRFGAVDVVPFVPLDGAGSPMEDGDSLQSAIATRDRFARWMGEELGVPCFVYGPERTLPELRKRAFVDLSPDFGPMSPRPGAGACAVGARHALVAYNLWFDHADIADARRIAAGIRCPRVRALAFSVGDCTQVSCNLVDPSTFGPSDAYDAVAKLAAHLGTHITRAELVGLVPATVLEKIAPERRRTLDVDVERTIEARLAGKKD